MNKKILSIFALIMAISILGVSCAENPNNPNNNGGSTPPISAEDAKKVVNAMNTVTAGTANFDLSAVDVTASGADYVVSVSSDEATKTVTPDEIKTALDDKKSDMQTAVTPNITIGEFTVPAADNSKTLTVTIPYTTEDGKTANFKITFELTASDSKFNGAASKIQITETDLKDALAEQVYTDAEGNDTFTFPASSGITLSGNGIQIDGEAGTASKAPSLTTLKGTDEGSLKKFLNDKLASKNLEVNDIQFDSTAAADGKEALTATVKIQVLTTASSTHALESSFGASYGSAGNGFKIKLTPTSNWQN